jgi:hypothetical protein
MSGEPTGLYFLKEPHSTGFESDFAAEAVD